MLTSTGLDVGLLAVGMVVTRNGNVDPGGSADAWFAADTRPDKLPSQYGALNPMVTIVMDRYDLKAVSRNVLWNLIDPDGA